MTGNISDKNPDEFGESLDFKSWVIDGASVWIHVNDENGKIVLWNKKAEEITGWKPEEVVGGSDIWKKLIPNESDRARIYTNLDSILSDSDTINDYHAELVTKSGEKKNVSWDLKAIKNRDGRVIRSIAIGKVIDPSTRRKSVSSEEATRLQVKISELEKIIASENEYLSFITHELRNPLVPIIGYSDMIREGAFGEISDELDKALESIMINAESMKTILDDVQGTLSAGFQKVTPNLTEIKASDLISDLRKIYYKANFGKKVDIVFGYEDCSFTADKFKLIQVIRNIIFNSVKYSGARVNILVAVSPELADYTAVISVTDDGIGIGEDNIAKIFDKNFQENSKQDTPRSGQGMGLYIAKNLVESMNGSISVISRKGEGSTFSIALPAAVRNNTLPSEK
jgi:hypothetical protein